MTMLHQVSESESLESEIQLSVASSPRDARIFAHMLKISKTTTQRTHHVSRKKRDEKKFV